jgi:L-alanine-DL-glutamate epimerase-like enolase superfamily enzyme
MKLQFFPFDLQFIHPFKVSVHSRTTTPIVVLKLEHEGVTGLGEASMPPYLGESQQSVMQFLSKIDLTPFKDPFQTEEILGYIDAIEKGNNAAKAGFDIALHDLAGKLQKKAVSEQYNIPFKPKKTSFTIGIDTPEKMEQKAREGIEMGFKILKIKLGTDYDRAILERMLSFWEGPFSVDANQGWKSKEEALELTNMLTEKGVLFIEQPFHFENLADSAWLTERSSVPIVADESIKRFSDLEKIRYSFSGINVKLMKSTGIAEAYRMIKVAKDSGLKVVTGCMAESSCAVGAMSHLSSLADWVDLDGPFLTKNDPFTGLYLDGGILHHSHEYGIGVSLNVALENI